ncbi:chemotaxis protein CheC [Shewanella avicenniae]|uniref:Chemotaxis protein CheC n=1 Tax=Shewanella avicenniae TaxID=2814294 RepID=A0ABX7QR69_9GAMM|nr:chemotaxis protein CheC [Shewanella avicenniae]QSX33186.1 chemotaxis protein CheC [Shewanella avicenniae]
MKAHLGEDQRDVLQELMNISMGQAANELAKLIETKITLSIPHIVSVTPEEFARIFESTDVNWFTRQSFLGGLHGEVITLLSKDGADAIASLMDYDLPLDESATEELMLELANILAGACLKGFTEQLGLKANLSMPTSYFPTAEKTDQFRWDSALLMEVEFNVEQSEFRSNVLICLEEHSVQSLIERLNSLLE